MHPADYSRHDAEYQRRGAAGYTGWNNATAAAEYLALLEQVFSAPHFPKPGRLLELGCGAGDFSLWAASRTRPCSAGSGQSLRRPFNEPLKRPGNAVCRRTSKWATFST